MSFGAELCQCMLKPAEGSASPDFSRGQGMGGNNGKEGKDEGKRREGMGKEGKREGQLRTNRSFSKSAARPITKTTVADF